MDDVLSAWTRDLAETLGLPDDVDIALILDLARDAAHGIARPAAPLTTFLVGLAAGRAGGDPDAVSRAAAAATDLVLSRGPSAETSP